MICRNRKNIPDVVTKELNPVKGLGGGNVKWSGSKNLCAFREKGHEFLRFGAGKEQSP